jgi:formate hydrogenlyase transcriptional activator
VILADGEVLRLVPGMLMREPASIESTVTVTNGTSDPRAEIEAVLRETRGKVYGPDGAAARFGLPASTLESRIRALKINKHQFK